MKRWKILNKINFQKIKDANQAITKILLENRGLTNKKAIQEFLNPKLENVSIKSVEIDKKQLKKAMGRIYRSIDKKEQIIIYGDYDVDGITGTAILWETLNSLGAKVMPYLPDRIEEGYGLSIKGISRLRQDYGGQANLKLIITVDNGIVANDAVEFANENGIDVIITDHHLKDKKLPDALAIVHTTKLCGAGIAYLLSQEISNFKFPSNPAGRQISNDQRLDSRLRGNDNGEGGNDNGEGGNDNKENDDHLELAALGTVADMVPLTGVNRAIVKFGLEKLAKTRRPGLRELFKQAGCDKNVLGVYEVGFMIAPRLNAAGRIENAMDGLRLLCTKDKKKARILAEKLELTNRERQLVMKQATTHASLSVKMQDSLKKILIVSHESYQQGIIGLVAGKLVDEYYRPSIVISMGEKHSKASGRSVDGFNLIEFLRTTPEYFVNVGGHPMAAGFTIETEKITAFKELIEKRAGKLLDGEALTKKLKIDCELPFSVINKEFYNNLAQLAPFGMGNPEPVFMTKDVTVDDLRVLGRDGKHLRLHLKDQSIRQAQDKRSKTKTTTLNSKLKTRDEISNVEFEGIAFGMGEMAREIKIGEAIDVAYTIDENTWNGNTKLQLKVKDIKKGN